MTKQVKSQIKDRIYSLLSEGVKQFPKNILQALTTEEIIPNESNALKLCLEDNIYNNILNCCLCPLSKSRKKVIVSSIKTKKKFFIISEFPESENEKSQSSILFCEKTSSSVIVKLVEKLGILQDCFFSFALKCVPEKGIPQGSLSLCAQNNLKQELVAVNPEVILCFGRRSLLAVAQFEPNLFSQKYLLDSLSENAFSFDLNFENSSKKVFFLSSSLDLQTFPHWRAQVWSFLEHFKADS